MIGKNIAPGLNRSFACEGWETIDKELWKEEKKAAYEAMSYDTELEIYGFDIDKKAVASARQNAEEAGVDDCITFERKDIAALKPMGMRGIIITNPPYGERIGALRALMHENPDWSLFMITTDKEAEEKVMRRKADRRRKLYNGRLEVCYYQYHGKKA